MAQIIKRGEGVYLIRIPLGADETGKRHFYNKTVHMKYGKAVKHARKLETRRDQGENIEPSNATLEEYLTEWLKVVKPRLSPRTHEGYTSLLKTHIYPLLGWKRLGTLSPLDIEMAYSAMEEAKKSRRTIQYVHTVLSSALRQAVQWRMIQHNPAADTDKRLRRRERKILIKPFNEEELDRFLKHAADSPHSVLFLVAVSSGLRPEEYLALGWQHFDEKARTLKVERVVVRHKKAWSFEPPKTVAGRRTVPIPQRTVEALAKLKREAGDLRLKNHNLIFAGAKGEPIDVGNLRERHFARILTAAKLEPRRLYDLRHSYATLLLATGVDAKTVSENLGHAGVAITLSVYAHVLPSMRQKLSETVEALFSR